MTPPLPLTVLAGLDRDAVADVAAGLLLTTPRLAVVWADPFTAELGYVQSRVTDSEGRCTEQTVELEHGCLSCAMREAVVRAVRRLAATGRYDAIVVHLHPGIEADAAILALDAELRGTARVDTVGVVVHAGWLDDLAGDADVTTRGIAVTPDDDRSAAMVVAAALDEASVLVLPGSVGDELTIEEHAALSTLCPDVVRLFPQTNLDVPARALVATRSYDPSTRTLFAGRGLLDAHQRLPAVSGALALVHWSADGRPLHPQRLREALDRIANGVIRSSGHLWVATHPDTAVHWYSAGDCLTLGPAGPWPGALRPNRVTLLGEALDEGHIRAVLDGCVLTDAEFRAGPAAWARLEDPFTEWRPADERGAA